MKALRLECGGRVLSAQPTHSTLTVCSVAHSSSATDSQINMTPKCHCRRYLISIFSLAVTIAVEQKLSEPRDAVAAKLR